MVRIVVEVDAPSERRAVEWIAWALHERNKVVPPVGYEVLGAVPDREDGSKR